MHLLCIIFGHKWHEYIFRAKGELLIPICQRCGANGTVRTRPKGTRGTPIPD